ncbi:conserved Plasmodium protein, unknown function [Plasmodium malariae]|uniref:Uncharacterized protein n=1 Tax=Plasmodium malariae TaxID=5858 RepID=A0A1A8VUI0_PLAMA|nr:conserved Plasmodium protein, unknown function [Plasmodium malariae]
MYYQDEMYTGKELDIPKDDKGEEESSMQKNRDMMYLSLSSHDFTDMHKKLNKRYTSNLNKEEHTNATVSLHDETVMMTMTNKNKDATYNYTQREKRNNKMSSSTSNHNDDDAKEIYNCRSTDHLNIRTTYADDFNFNYYMIDTIYVLFNYYMNLSEKKKNDKNNLSFFFFLPDIKNNIMNIVLNFITTLKDELNKNKQLKNKKIIASLERVLKLGYAFQVPFKLEPFIFYYLNVLLVSKFDLSLLDNIKILAIFREVHNMNRGSNMNRTGKMEVAKERINEGENDIAKREEERVNEGENGIAKREEERVNEGKSITSEKVEEENTILPDEIAKIKIYTGQAEKNPKKKKKKFDLCSSSQFNTKLSSYIHAPNEMYNANSYLLDNMIKLVFDNLKKCLHTSKGSDICMLIPIVYEFHKYMDEELKNILTVQVTCNRDNINETNFINILRVFSKMKYKNELVNKFLYNVKYLASYKKSNGLTNEQSSDNDSMQNVYSFFFSCPKFFFLFFYYKSKNNLFTYKDVYYVENFIQNSFFEMNVKDFIFVLLIYYKNGIVLLPQLLLKICAIFNNGKKIIKREELLFCLFLLSKNYYALSNSASGRIDSSGNSGSYYRALGNKEDNFLMKKMNVFRKSQYTQHHIDSFINVINDILLYIYDDKMINYQADLMKHLQEEGNIRNTVEGEGKKTNDGKNNEKEEAYSEDIKVIHHNNTYMVNSEIYTCKMDFNSYLNIYSPFYFKKQICYILKNCIMDDQLVKHILLSHVFMKQKISTEIKKYIKEYVITHFEHFSMNLQVLFFKFCNNFLNMKNIENTDEQKDSLLFDQLLNNIFLNLAKMKPNNYLDIYFTISNNMVKDKKYYIQLFYYMNKCADHYTGEQLLLILFYMYKTGYSKPKIRKKVRNLILHHHKKRLINLSTYIKYILPLDEFGIYHLLPIKFQQVIYDQLGEDVKPYVRQPLKNDEVKKLKK